jgi:hypothetical protein
MGKIQTVYREQGEPRWCGPAPDPRFAVEFSDRHREVVEAADEADALRQARNAYVGPAIVIAVQLTGRSIA